MGRPSQQAFSKNRANCRVGFYLRIIEEGEVGAGDRFERTQLGPERMTVREMCHLLYFDPYNVEGATKAHSTIGPVL